VDVHEPIVGRLATCRRRARRYSACLPRKGGGPDLEISSSTGSGGTSG
jgi:hypothetical protein